MFIEGINISRPQSTLSHVSSLSPATAPFYCAPPVHPLTPTLSGSLLHLGLWEAHDPTSTTLAPADLRSVGIHQGRSSRCRGLQQEWVEHLTTATSFAAPGWASGPSPVYLGMSAATVMRRWLPGTRVRRVRPGQQWGRVGRVHEKRKRDGLIKIMIKYKICLNFCHVGLIGGPKQSENG
jgi:hypothetical protein